MILSPYPYSMYNYTIEKYKKNMGYLIKKSMAINYRNKTKKKKKSDYNVINPTKNWSLIDVKAPTTNIG